MVWLGPRQLPQRGHNPFGTNKYHKYNLWADILIQGHFHQVNGLFFDVRITNLVDNSQVQMEQFKLVEVCEKKNKKKYPVICPKNINAPPH